LASRQSVPSITCGSPVFLDQELVCFDRIAVKANDQQFQKQGLPLASIDSMDPYFVRHAAYAQSYDAPERPGPYSPGQGSPDARRRLRPLTCFGAGPPTGPCGFTPL
jgi:hypothetical protein